MDEAAAAAEIAWLGEAPSMDAGQVGPKAAHLSALAVSHPVPAGFCLTAHAYRTARRTGRLSRALRAAVVDAYQRLVQGASEGGYVAVRSSALDEDGAEASFAGQHDTRLNVIGTEALIDAIESTWASLHGAAALAYRRQRGLGERNLALAVLVQRMVWADAAGVAFSIDPVAGATDRVVVNAAWGLGEGVVAGIVAADTWHLAKPALDVVEASVAEKERMVIPDERGTRDVAVPGFLRRRASLTDGELARVGQLALDLERERGWPVDLEFAWRDGVLALLQCRPVTTRVARA
jgi:phosphoenolpyruvate synthase/pyruvate phosphate dikinase